MQSLKLTIIVILELIVGMIIFLGGTALAILATDKILGIIHAGLGLLAFPVAYGLWRRDSWAWNAALLLNVTSILYSTVSEVIVVNGVLLPGNALQSSIGGTIVAIILSIAIVVLLAQEKLLPSRLRRQLSSKTLRIVSNIEIHIHEFLVKVIEPVL